MAQQPFKDWKTFAEQIDLLEQRGMVFHDKAQAEKELARIGYYRLSAYWYPFRQHLATGGRDDVFVANTQFNDVIALCLMQRMLNVICPQHDWGQRFQAALKTFPFDNATPHEINLDKMGMGGLSLADLSAWQLWQHQA